MPGVRVYLVVALCATSSLALFESSPEVEELLGAPLPSCSRRPAFQLLPSEASWAPCPALLRRRVRPHACCFYLVPPPGQSP